MSALPPKAVLKAARLTRQAYLKTVGPVPPLPSAVFSSDPRRARLISYGRYDGFPVRLADTGEIWVCFNGTWSERSRPTQVFCYEAGVLTEQEVSPDFRSRPAAPARHCFLFRLALAVDLRSRAALPLCRQPSVLPVDRDPANVRRHADRRDAGGVAAGASLVRGYTATQAGYLRFCTVDWIVGLSQAP